MKTLVRTNATLFPSLPSLLEDFFEREFSDSSVVRGIKGGTLPAVNVIEGEVDFMIQVAAPGMKRNDFKIELENDVLTILAQGKEQQDKVEKNFTRREFNYQSFQRSFSLPEKQVEAEKISARYVDGILEINIPKKDATKAKQVRQITIG